MVESQPSKLLVAGSIPVSRSILFLSTTIDEVLAFMSGFPVALTSAGTSLVIGPERQD